MGLLSKIKYHSLLSSYFKRVGGCLKDGFYIVKDNKVSMTKLTFRNFHKVFKVKSRKSIEFPYDGGKLFITKYKYGLLTKDKAYYFIHDKARYDSNKLSYSTYRSELVYPAFDLEFHDEERLIVAPIVNGAVYKDLSHFDLFLDRLFELADQSKPVEKKTTIFDNEFILPWYVQHGDCKNGNIVWNCDDSFTMIDLEAIGLYPPLYDVLYYLFITQAEKSIAILKSKEFADKVVSFYSKRLKTIPDNIIDITLANYAYYTSSKLEKGSELYEFEFYLYWREYDSFDDYPLTRRVLDEYERKLKEYNIK